MLMVSDAYAQGLFGGGGPAASGSPNPTMTFLLQIAQFLPIIAIFYLLLIRPQQQQAKKLKAMLAALKKGDKVVTSGGLIGTIVGLDEQKARAARRGRRQDGVRQERHRERRDGGPAEVSLRPVRIYGDPVLRDRAVEVPGGGRHPAAARSPTCARP